MQNTNTIQLGQHVHRSLVDATVVSFNKETKKIEIDVQDLAPELVPILRNRARSRSGPNIPVEVFIAYDAGDKHLAYKVTTNRYGVTAVPWSMVSPEDLRKDTTILAFKTKKEGEYLTLATGDTIVGASYQNEKDTQVICDAKLAEGDLFSAMIDGVFYIFDATSGYNILYVFRDLDDINPEHVFAEYSANHRFTL